MKTPREILFQRYHSAGPALDAIREKAVAGIAGPSAQPSLPVEAPFSWGEFLFSFRRHLAALATVWLVIIGLHLDIGSHPNHAAALAREKVPSPQIILASLRESRRQILELIQSPDPHTADPQKLFVPRPRSQRRFEII